MNDETIKRDVGAVILALESLVADQIAATLPAAASAGVQVHPNSRTF